MTTTTIRMASDKQYNLISKLLHERDLDVTKETDTLIEYFRERDLDSRSASRMIDLLFAAPRKATQQDNLPLGYYVKDGIIYKVVESAAGKTYAKVQVSGAKFAYAPGAILKLTAGDKLTPEIASAMSLEAKRCCMCHKKIEVTESVQRGVGPKCWAKLAG